MGFRYTGDFGPNVEQILCGGSRVIRGRVPQQVRAELMAAVRAGVLGRLKKDGLKPEVFFHPDHKHGAAERQAREAAYAVQCVGAVMVSPADIRAAIESNGGDVLEYALGDLASLSPKDTGGEDE